MQIPLQITSRDMPLTEAIEQTIRAKATKLDQFYPQIMGCRVSIETPHRHHHKGVLYNVRILITVPGGELVVKREPHEDLYVAIRDAFDAARRQLQGHATRRRGDVKIHEEAPQGRITELLPAEGYGFVTTVEGREIYFHRNSVVNRTFDDLRLGDHVRFVEKPGDQGPQASTVAVM